MGASFEKDLAEENKSLWNTKKHTNKIGSIYA